MRMNGLCSHSRSTVLGSLWPGSIIVAAVELHQRPHDRVLERLVGGVAGARTPPTESRKSVSPVKTAAEPW